MQALDEFQIDAVRQDLTAQAPDPLRRVHAYWDERRGARAMPARADIDPLDLRFVLGRVNLIDVRPRPPRFVFRLRGSDISRLHKNDYTNEPVDRVEPAAYRDMLIRHYAEVAETGRPSLYSIHQRRSDVVADYLRLALPLSEDGLTVTMVLTASHWDDRFLRAVDKLGFKR